MPVLEEVERKYFIKGYKMGKGFQKVGLVAVALTSIFFNGCAVKDAFIESGVEKKEMKIGRLSQSDVAYIGKKSLTQLYNKTKDNENVYVISGEGSYNTFTDVTEVQRKQNTQLALLYTAAVKALWEEKQGFKVLYPAALKNEKLNTLEEFKEKCEVSIYLQDCANVFKYCAEKGQYENSGFIIVELSDADDKNGTYFKAEPLADNIVKNYNYSKYKKPTKEQLEFYRKYKKQIAANKK